MHLRSYLAAATFNETSIMVSSVSSLSVFGAANTTFDCIVAGNAGPVFNIINSTVSLSSLSFQNCNSPTSAGGAIATTSSNLALLSCSFKNNSAPAGGAVSAVGGLLLVNGSVFVGNSAACNAPICFTWGGAIAALETLVVTVVSCVFSLNTVSMPFLMPPPGSFGSVSVGGGGGISVRFDGNASNAQASFINNLFDRCTVTAGPVPKGSPSSNSFFLYNPISWISGGAVSLNYGFSAAANALFVSNISSTAQNNTCSNCQVSVYSTSVGGGDGGCFSFRVGAFLINAGNSTVLASNIRFLFSGNSVVDCGVVAGGPGTYFAACLGGGISVVVGSSAYGLGNGSTSMALGDTHIFNSSVSFTENSVLSCICSVKATSLKAQQSQSDIIQPPIVQQAFGGGLSVFLGATAVLAYEVLASPSVSSDFTPFAYTRGTASVGATFVLTSVVDVSNNVFRNCSSVFSNVEGGTASNHSAHTRGGGSSIMIGGFASLLRLTHENQQLLFPVNASVCYGPMCSLQFYMFGAVSAGSAVVSHSSILANSNSIYGCQALSSVHNIEPASAFWLLSSGGGLSVHIGSSLYYAASALEPVSSFSPVLILVILNVPNGHVGDTNVSDSFVNVSGNRISDSRAASLSLRQTNTYCSSSAGGGVDITIGALLLCGPTLQFEGSQSIQSINVLRSSIIFASNSFSRCAAFVQGSDTGQNVYGGRSFGGGLGISFGVFFCSVCGIFSGNRAATIGYSSFVDIIVIARFNSFAACSATSSLPSDGLAFGLIAMGGSIGLSFGAYLLYINILTGPVFINPNIDVLHLSYVTANLSANTIDSSVAASIVTGGGASYDLQANGGAAALVFGAQCHAFSNADEIVVNIGLPLGVKSGTLCSVNSITASFVTILMQDNTLVSCSAQNIYTSNSSVLVESRGTVASGGGVAVLMRGFSYSKGFLSGGPSISIVAPSSLSSVFVSVVNNSFSNCFVARSSTLSADTEVGRPICL